MNGRLLLLACVLVVGALMVVGFARRDGSSASGHRPGEWPPDSGSELESKRQDRPGKGTRMSLAERRVQGLSLQEVLARLPGEPDPLFSSRSGGESEETVALLQRLGVLLGGEAIDLLIERYGDNAFTIQAIGPALAGWATVDPAAASEALLALEHNTEDQVQEHSRTRVTWNGRVLLVEGDFSGFVVGASLAEGLRAVAQEDSARALRVLQQLESPPDGFHLSAYLSAFGASTDWLAIREDLVALEPMGGEEAVTTATARAWARWDFEEALDWFLAEKEAGDQSLYTRARPILISYHTRTQSIDWLEVRVRSGEVNGEEVVNFAGQLRGNVTGGMLERIVAMPKEESRRHEIVESWITPELVHDEVSPWFAPDVLRDLIAAARLPAAEAAALREVVERNAHLTPIYSGE